MGAAGSHFGVPIETSAAHFSFLTGGIFAGYIASLFAFSFVSERLIFVVSSGAILLFVLLIRASSSLSTVSASMFGAGFSASLLACGAGTLIARVWVGRARQAILISQDAVFNGGGILVSIVTPLLLAGGFHWATIHLFVAAIAVSIALISSLAAIFPTEISGEAVSKLPITAGWNSGLVLAGLSLLLFFLAKISIFVWSPQFAESRFGDGSDLPGNMMSGLFFGAFSGAMVGVYLASRMPIRRLLAALVVLGIASLVVVYFGNSSLIAIGAITCYGISVSATFNAYVAFGLGFTTSPMHHHVAFLFLCASFGGAVAPFVSSRVVAVTNGDPGAAIIFAIGVLTVTYAILSISMFVKKA